jgi:hypothetical protein
MEYKTHLNGTGIITFILLSNAHQGHTV